MTFKTITSLVITSTCIVLMTASCSEEVVYRRSFPGRGYGPPAHAAAHGHRRKYVHGVELIFDAGMGLYVVPGCVDHYYYDGYFFRLHGGLWELSLYPDRGWGPLGRKSLPPGLHAKGNGKIKSPVTGQSHSKIESSSGGQSPGKSLGNGRGRGHGKHKKKS